MEINTESPLRPSDLEAAASLCLACAATTDLDQFPPGSGSFINSLFHDRKNRFEIALERANRGVSNIQDLGLSVRDLSWAISQADRAKDQVGWKNRFATAKVRLEAIVSPTSTE